MADLRTMLLNMHFFTDGCVEALEKVIGVKQVENGDMLLNSGRVCYNLYLVEKGLLRTFYLNGGKEVTSSFTKENGICVSLGSFLTQQPSPVAIQAIEPSKVISLGYFEYSAFNLRYPDFNAATRVIIEECLMRKEMVMREFWMQSATHKHRWFRDHYPDYYQRVPGIYLASYLGMTNVMLSRIRTRESVLLSGWEKLSYTPGGGT